MDENEHYGQQVHLLVQLLPFINQEACFALKGGTAINLFVRDMPRLSVDIDLVYLPMQARDQSLIDIHAALDRIAANIEAGMSGIKLQKYYRDKRDALRLLVSNGKTQVKIELSPVLRGTVNACVRRSVSAKVEDLFGYAEMQLVALEDLYAGKICAALDRQHPRDLFDVHLLLEHEGLTEGIRKTLLVYLLSHNRPLEELLAPNRLEIEASFFAEFEGMAFIDISLEQLLEAREKLITLVNQALTDDERLFLLSFLQGQPDNSLWAGPEIAALPALRWKRLNLEKMSEEKRFAMLEKAKEVLKV